MIYPGLENKVALIVGGTSGIGLAAAALFVAAGARVVIAGRDTKKGEAAQTSLGEAALFVPCDISDVVSVTALFQAVTDRFGRLDCAVNTAAVAQSPAMLHEMSDEQAAALLNTDVHGQFLCLKREIAMMQAQGGGTIVNVSSVNGLSGVAGAAMYSAGRHAVLGLTRSVAREYIGQHIRINAVCPGATDTPRRQQRMAAVPEAMRQEIQAHTAQAIPLGRLATADEIAQAILWLSSPVSSYVVGHCLVVDGGLSA
ncbi:SDR family NAD(P)-dependent oxidoreductase [Chitinimonas sp. BJYL2]|uniref:SDR family NAD(P)-dependent oxidoreductase n=1 Tax=Chitinimonas sp. BJYL2 TaxID=2976696 RepID=UPI0022B39F46|nr:SDR family oxidoreductase [Chitinimonas sp. BJYL2]